ncbi:amino acid adenylation domain-containing protein [Roseibium sp. TrichSKD4]|nr:amino acid adenylation domain-containing protein [Roseibium sp. TrichSKD4]
MWIRFAFIAERRATCATETPGTLACKQIDRFSSSDQNRFLLPFFVPKMCLTMSINENGHYHPTALPVRAGIPNAHTANTTPTFLKNERIEPDDIAMVLFTSGTTGVPNGVQVTHKNLANILQTAPGDLSMRPGLRVGQILSIAFDMAAWEILGALSNGATLVIRGKSIQETAEKVDVLISTPSILASLDHTRYRQVKVAAVAGEPCPRSLADTWGAFCSFHNSCGPTETTIINTAE